MHILFIGDIYASPGRRIVSDNLRRIVTDERIDLIIANVENSAGGFGVTPQIAEDMLSMGVEVMTTAVATAGQLCADASRNRHVCWKSQEWVALRGAEPAGPDIYGDD
jgi:hypothetical protein